MQVTEPRWAEVGERFSRLGRTMQARWAESGDSGADAAEHAHEVRGAMDGVRESLNDLADAINRTVNDDEVHESARDAASGLVEALSQSLDQLADKIQPKRPPD